MQQLETDIWLCWVERASPKNTALTESDCICAKKNKQNNGKKKQRKNKHNNKTQVFTRFCG